MKKLTLFTVILMLTANFSFSQVRDGVVSYQKTKQPAAVIELPYSSNVVETAIENYMGTKGVKGNESRGFKTYKGVRLGDTLTGDLYFKVERKSQKESTVYLVAAPANENLNERNTAMAYAASETRNMLSDLIPTAESSNMEMQIKEQEDEVSKAEKRLRSLMEDASDLQKRKANIEERIRENEQAQEKQKSEIEKQRLQLADLIRKRRS